MESGVTIILVEGAIKTTKKTKYEFIIEEPEPILGCTDPDALNYNPDAEIDDGSCEYVGYVLETSIIKTNYQYGQTGTIEIRDSDGVLLYTLNDDSTEIDFTGSQEITVSWIPPSGEYQFVEWTGTLEQAGIDNPTNHNQFITINGNYTLHANVRELDS